MITLLNKLQDLLDLTKSLDFMASLLLRLYLAPIFWMAGTKKLKDMDSTIQWFGNPDWGLGLPYPHILAWAATITEAGGAILLVIGLAVRWISIPLMITMIVAAVTAHLNNGWLAIAEADSLFASERTTEATEKLNIAKNILREHGNYDWLTSNGSFVILNNGIEFATTYFIMLLALLFLGGGKYFSVDHWIAKKYRT